MYKIGDYVVYKKDVCKIKNIKTNDLNGKTSYVMVPVADETLTIDVPVENNSVLRDLISKEEAEQIILEIPKIRPLDNLNDKTLEQQYKDLIASGTYEDYVKVIKSAYIRNNNRLQNKKKPSEKDDKYFKLAEKYLYSELSAALGLDYNEAKDFIVQKVQEFTN